MENGFVLFFFSLFFRLFVDFRWKVIGITVVAKVESMDLASILLIISINCHIYSGNNDNSHKPNTLHN